MRSGGSPALLVLDRNLPTTAADVAALRHAWAAQPVSVDERLEFFQRFELPTVERLRSRPGPVGPPLDPGP